MKYPIAQFVKAIGDLYSRGLKPVHAFFDDEAARELRIAIVECGTAIFASRDPNSDPPEPARPPTRHDSYMGKLFNVDCWTVIGMPRGTFVVAPSNEEVTDGEVAAFLEKSEAMKNGPYR